MNERIQKIAEQAGYHPDMYAVCKPGMEQFAKLLIEECANYVDVYYGMVAPCSGESIKEYFGISKLC